ncbi:hypothetical protein [Actinophytocola gossypii]|uniref:Uncharacterized protein n=1 Tax=Actinophytocola gossypii TaxID=2812003 RepID=A0ABT2JHV5_9PSEU|nr:hypothetical protein [Actinophytocola gossypii]MCT2587468.1 hypothetical protein [Actinophytocola gossypii]
MEHAQPNPRARIHALGLPETVARVAVDGGDAVHPALSYRAEPIGDPAWSVITESGRTDLTPLWACGTTTAFACDDGTFLEWDAEEDEPWRTFPDFEGLVRSLLTDLYEDEEPEAARQEIARALLPGRPTDRVLRPEDRDASEA